MAENPPGPSVEELQKTVADLTEQINQMKAEKAKTDSLQAQYDKLKQDHDALMQTNMKLIQYIPSSGSKAAESEGKPKDIMSMSEDERYVYLKDMAQKGIKQDNQ